MTSLEKPTGIPRDGAERKTGAPARRDQGRKLSGYVLFDDKYVQYFTSFGTSRPSVPSRSPRRLAASMAVFVPEFEVERVRAETEFERVESYPEYPGIEHPMRIFARVLADMGIAGAIGADQDGYPGILGYQGPALSEVTGTSVTPLGAVDREHDGAQERRARLALIRESAGGASTRTGCSRSTACRGRPKPRRACAPVTRRRSRCSRRSANRSAASRGRRTALRRGTAARSACAARGRTRSRTTSCSRQVTSS